MVKMVGSEDYKVRKKSIEIILNIIKVGIEGLKEGEQHPYYQKLQSDQTIQKLIQLFKDEKDRDTINYIAQTLAHIFKARPLPTEIKNDIIEELKPCEIDELAFLSENRDENKKKVALAVKKKVIELTDYYQEEVKQKAQEILSLIKNILSKEEEEENDDE
ncbi:MAG: hypothetical protein EZS28_019842 [Streblomastix strix]|uniref:Condensin complex subunit 1 C-terminal domain-containing protein n=1 Tax=Streblomastix strix TaxID=222440 RepID=A0A5J4VQ56_9EUKA|nr:MAG: hypothetical protein EZS28_019842 [Streblomastix strix]